MVSSYNFIPSLEAGLASFLLVVGILDPFSHSRVFCLVAVLGHVGLGIDLVWALDELHGQTTLNVPHNVAVHEPGTWVVGLEADDGVTQRRARAATSEHDCVTTGRVDEVEGADVGECAEAFAEDGHVVTVQMHGVRGKNWLATTK